MRSVLLIISLVLIAGVGRAQETAPPPPDFSRDHLRQVFTTEPREPLPERNLRVVGPGVIEFRALGMDWRISFLPFFAPLPGSVPGTTHVLPDAFSMTGMTIPGTLPEAPKDEDVKKERRRIERLAK